MNYNETLDTLSYFYADCMKFWKYDTDKALKDVENITTNPFDPNGQPLDLEAKRDFIEYIKEVWE